MKQNYFPLIVILVVILISSTVGVATAQDQQPVSVRLNGYYEGSLTEVLNRISREHNVQFTFDKEKLNKYKVEDFMENKLLTEFLDYWCGLFELRYQIDGGGVVRIVDAASYQQEEGKLKADEETRKKNYAGPPTSFNISVSGKVTDATTGESLPFGSVIVKGSRLGTTMNADGLFTLQNIPSDTSINVVNTLGIFRRYTRIRFCLK